MKNKTELTEKELFLSGLAESVAPWEKHNGCPPENWSWSKLTIDQAEKIWEELSSGVPSTMKEMIEAGGYDFGVEIGTPDGLAYLIDTVNALHHFELI